MPTLTKPRKKEASKKKGPKVQQATVKSPRKAKAAAVTTKVTRAKKAVPLDIEKARSLAVSQMRAYLPEYGLELDPSAKNPTFRNDAGVRVSLRGHHADGTVASPIISYYLAVAGPGTKIKKYPQRRTGHFSWENIKTKLAELNSMSSRTKWQEISARLEGKVPSGVLVKFLPGSSDKKVRIRFQFDKDMDETQVVQLFEAMAKSATA